MAIRHLKLITKSLLFCNVIFMQHLYVYGVLVFEAMATFIGQVSVLSLIAIFGAATTAMVRASFSSSIKTNFNAFSSEDLILVTGNSTWYFHTHSMHEKRMNNYNNRGLL